ncbi:MAG: dienelactone hydrolase family protein [Acidimicrobiales bacterium]
MRITLASGTAAELVTVPDASVGLVLVPDIMGLRPLFDELCARLARDNGWNVCSFELFAGNEHLDRDERMIAAKDLDDERILDDALAAATATDCGVVNIIGFCMGGMYTLKSVRTARFHRLVPFYGMIHVPENWHGARQGDPLDAVRQGDPQRVLAIVGTADPFTPPAAVEELESVGVTVVRYQGADHAFVHDPDRPSHNPQYAIDAWARAIYWLTG